MGSPRCLHWPIWSHCKLQLRLYRRHHSNVHMLHFPLTDFRSMFKMPIETIWATIITHLSVVFCDSYLGLIHIECNFYDTRPNKEDFNQFDASNGERMDKCSKRRVIKGIMWEGQVMDADMVRMQNAGKERCGREQRKRSPLTRTQHMTISPG